MEENEKRVLEVIMNEKEKYFKCGLDDDEIKMMAAFCAACEAVLGVLIKDKGEDIGTALYNKAVREALKDYLRHEKIYENDFN